MHCIAMQYLGDYMSDQVRPPDNKQTIDYEGYRLVCYDYGTSGEVVLALNGGPGLSSEYLRVPHARIADQGFRLVTFDQLGTGESDRPSDPSLWTIERYAAEVEAVREKLGLGRVHLLGHSWGGWLANEYAVRYPENLKTLILQSTCADMPHLVAELDRLRSALGPETVAMMLRHEAEGRWDHPEYQAAITLLNYRHVCRLAEWPAPLRNCLEAANREIYQHMQGPNEFHYIGNLRHWRRIDELQALTIPVLITAGQHDEITPACALRMKSVLQQAEVRIFPNSSHMPFYEEPEAFFAVLLDFLGRHRGRGLEATTREPPA